VALALGLAFAVASPARPQQPAARDPEAFLSMGVRHYGEGDFDAAVFSLDVAARRLAGDASRRASLIKARLYLGATYVALGREDQARAEFREVLTVDPSARPGADLFPPKVLRVFEAVTLEKTVAKKKKTGRLILILGGVGAAGAVGIAAATSGGPPANRPPTVTIAVSPAGQAIVGITTMTLTASATDPDGDPLTYAWTLGDGGTASGATVTHRYNGEGTFNVGLTVSDGRGLSATATASVTARSLTGSWREAGFVTGTLLWTQNGSGLSVRNADSANDRFQTWLGGSVSEPRRVAIEVRFTFASQFDGRYVGEANEQLDRVTVTREGGGTTFTFSR
jgi:hypothetical protein